MNRPLVTILVITVALAACTPATPGSGLTEIEQNRETWQNASVSHYRYHLFIGCFCVFTQDMPLVIEVVDGRAVSMEYENGNPIDPELLEIFRRYETIDLIFTELEAGLNGAADRVTVSYDPVYGFPAEATIDVLEETADDELYLTLSSFEELP